MTQYDYAPDDDPLDKVPPTKADPVPRAAGRGGPTMMDDVASDLALWIDQTATSVALAFAPGRAPFSANVTEEQKLQFYRSQLFNPDGSPNAAGRATEQARLGDEGFARVYKAVLARYPELKPPPPQPIQVPEQWPPAPLTGMPPGPPPMPPPPGPPPPGLPVGPPPGPPIPPGLPGPPPSGPPIGPMMPVRAMATGGVVTRPTLALIGEAGPEAVVPLPDYQYGGAPDPDLSAHLGNAPGADATPPTPSHEEIAAYIQQAARARGIDPNAALQVALHEGTNPATHRFDSPAQEAQFNTGRSWWPFQLHYGGAGYEQYGTTAGLGNDFTADTGIQPGDPRAWREATDYALDKAISNPSGWAQWYGSKPAKVAARQGLPARRG